MFHDEVFMAQGEMPATRNFLTGKEARNLKKLISAPNVLLLRTGESVAYVEADRRSSLPTIL